MRMRMPVAMAMLVAVIMVMVVVPVIVAMRLVVMMIEPLPRPRIIREHERLDRHRHGTRRQPHLAEIDVIEIPQHHAVDHEHLALASSSSFNMWPSDCAMSPSSTMNSGLPTAIMSSSPCAMPCANALMRS